MGTHSRAQDYCVAQIPIFRVLEPSKEVGRMRKSLVRSQDMAKGSTPGNPGANLREHLRGKLSLRVIAHDSKIPLYTLTGTKLFAFSNPRLDKQTPNGVRKKLLRILK